MPCRNFAFTVQHFDALTKHKAKGRRWVTKEQYIRFFMLSYSVLYPDSGMSEEEQRAALEVREHVACVR